MHPTSPLFPVALHGLARRISSVPGHGDFEGCKHIVRIDIQGLGRGATHGWQVRYQGRTRFFSDRSRTHGCSSPFESLQAAVNHLANCYEGPKLIRQAEERGNKLTKVGRTGVRVVLAPKKGRRGLQVYVEVTSPDKGLSPRRLYAGMEGQVSDAKLESLIEEGAKMRQAWQADIEAQRQSDYWAKCGELTRAPLTSAQSDTPGTLSVTPAPGVVVNRLEPEMTATNFWLASTTAD